MLSEATHWMLPLGEWYSLPSIILGVLILHFSLRQLNNNQNVGPLTPISAKRSHSSPCRWYS